MLHAVGYITVNLPNPKAGYQAFMSHNQNLVDQTSLNRYWQPDEFYMSHEFYILIQSSEGKQEKPFHFSG